MRTRSLMRAAAGIFLGLMSTSSLLAQGTQFPPLERPTYPEATIQSMDEGEGDDEDEVDYLFGPSEPITLFPENDLISVGGWVQSGYYTGSTAQFNSNPDRYNFNQVWLYAEREADGSDGIDFGGRVDIMYGTDADDTQAFGGPAGTWDFMNGWDRGGGYGWAMPQLYGEVAIGDLSIKAGHFYTLLGYEVVTAPHNFFYSHALTMYNTEAFTHTGALATYKASDNLTFYGGWTLGWDTGFSQLNGGNNFLGGVSAQVLEDVTVTYITTVGDLGSRGSGYAHSIVVDVNLTEKLNYVFQSDLLLTDTAVADDEYSFNQYLFYNWSDTLGFGLRGEFWSSDGVGNWEITYGLNYRPMANFVVRPEVRHQNIPTLLPGFEAVVFGVDGIITF